MENNKQKDGKIEEQINLTLQSIEGLQRAKANPFLYEKVMARINQPPVQDIPGWNYGTGVKYALIMLLFLVLNIATILQMSNGNSSVKVTQGTSGTTNTQTTQDKDSKGYFDDFINNNSGYYNY